MQETDRIWADSLDTCRKNPSRDLISWSAEQIYLMPETILPDYYEVVKTSACMLYLRSRAGETKERFMP